MDTPTTLRFAYRLPAARAVLMVLVSFAVAVGSAYIASTNQKALRIFGLVTLPPDAASTLFWLFAILSLAVALLAVWLGIRSHVGAGYVELGPTSAVVPMASLSGGPLTVPYSAIKRVSTLNVPGQQLVIIASSVGEARLMSNSFATQREFAEFLNALQARTGG